MSESTVIDKTKVVTVTDPKVDAAAREKLVTARIGLLLKAPFFGQLATRMTLTNADDWCGTAATDGRKFYYNSEFVNKMPLKQLEFLCGHEILHAVYDHMSRRVDRQPRLANRHRRFLRIRDQGNWPVESAEGSFRDIERLLD